MVQQAQRPLIVIGQESWWDMTEVKVELAKLHQRIVVNTRQAFQMFLTPYHSSLMQLSLLLKTQKHYVQTLLYI